LVLIFIPSYAIASDSDDVGNFGQVTPVFGMRGAYNQASFSISRNGDYPGVVRDHDTEYYLVGFQLEGRKDAVGFGFTGSTGIILGRLAGSADSDGVVASEVGWYMGLGAMYKAIIVGVRFYSSSLDLSTDIGGTGRTVSVLSSQATRNTLALRTEIAGIGPLRVGAELASDSLDMSHNSWWSDPETEDSIEIGVFSDDWYFALTITVDMLRLVGR